MPSDFIDVSKLTIEIIEDPIPFSGDGHNSIDKFVSMEEDGQTQRILQEQEEVKEQFDRQILDALANDQSIVYPNDESSNFLSVPEVNTSRLMQQQNQQSQQESLQESEKISSLDPFE